MSEQHLIDIADALAALAELETRLEDRIALYTECHHIKDAHALDFPYWPVEPTSEQWEDRGSDEQYLRLHWPHGRGPRPGPNKPPQAKTYIGNKKHRIALARRMVENLRVLRQLKSQLDRTQHEIRSTGWSLSRTSNSLARQCEDARETLAALEEGPAET